MTTEHSPAVEAAVAKHAEARAAFEKLRDDADRLAAELETHRKAAAAAEAEANAVRESARALIRDGNSSPKKLHELKAQERAAYTLAEDYRSIVAEVEGLLVRAKIEAGDARYDESQCYVGIISARREERLLQLSEIVQPLVPIMALIELCMQYDTEWGHWAHLAFDSPQAAMLHEIDKALKTAYARAGDDAKKDQVLASVTRPGGLGRFETMSPAKKHVASVAVETARPRNVPIADATGGQ